jgi:peptidase M28-like protein
MAIEFAPPFTVDPGRIRALDQKSGPLSSAALMAELEALARGFPDRQYGTDQGKRAAVHLAERMDAIGLEPLGDQPRPVEKSTSRWLTGPWGKRDEVEDEAKTDGAKNDAAKDEAKKDEEAAPEVELRRSFLQEFEAKEKKGRNVIGLIPGTDPILKNEVVVVSFHFDSQKATKEGANDNASGGAIALAIGKILAKKPAKRSVCIVAFDGEEVGKLGSNYYVRNPAFPLSKTALLVNIDEAAQVHLESGPRSEIYQWSTQDSFAKKVLKKASEKALKPFEVAVHGYPEQTYEAQFFTTDALPFFKRGIPVINLLSGRDIENHGTGDNMERVIPERLVQYGKLAFASVLEAANHPEPIVRALGRSPDTSPPVFPLLDLKRSRDLSASRGVRSDSRFEIDAKMPRFRTLATKLVEAVGAPEVLARAGLTKTAVAGKGSLHNEAALNRVRIAHRTATAALHQIPKNDVEARRIATERAAVIAGIEGVLAGALYVTNLRGANRYQTQRIPEKLGELVSGARTLGLDEIVKDEVSDEDTAPFSTIVSPTRALEIARDSLDEFPGALLKALYAMTKPEEAREYLPRLDEKDVEHLRERLAALEKRDGEESREVFEAKTLLSAAEAALQIDKLFEGGKFRKTASLAELLKRIEEVKSSIESLGAEEISAELSFWTSWIRTFEPVDALVTKQKDERTKALSGCREELLKLWVANRPELPGLSDEDRAAPKRALEAVQKELDRAESDKRALDPKPTWTPTWIKTGGSEKSGSESKGSSGSELVISDLSCSSTNFDPTKSGSGFLGSGLGSSEKKPSGFVGPGYPSSEKRELIVPVKSEEDERKAAEKKRLEAPIRARLERIIAEKGELKRRIEPFAKVESEIKWVESGLSSDDLKRAIATLSERLSKDAVAELDRLFTVFSEIEDHQGIELGEARGCALYEVRAMNRPLPKKPSYTSSGSSSYEYSDYYF